MVITTGVLRFGDGDAGREVRGQRGVRAEGCAGRGLCGLGRAGQHDRPVAQPGPRGCYWGSLAIGM